jgi:hypothetical protein
MVKTVLLREFRNGVNRRCIVCFLIKEPHPVDLCLQ